VNVLTILATRGLGVPVLVSERNDPAKRLIGRAWDRLRALTYPYADRIVIQDETVRDSFSSRLHKKMVKIPNPIPPPAVSEQSEYSVKRPAVVAMGRLVEQKGFDLLIRAFSELNDFYRSWTLVIFGEGPLRKDLETLRDELNLTEHVELPGRVKDPYGVLRQADLFVLSSRFEGFPNALCEAMTCGLAVIATDCTGGVREIVRHGVDGILVPSEDVNGLREAMGFLMSDENERQRLGDRGREVVERFSVENVMSLWDGVLDSCR